MKTKYLLLILALTFMFVGCSDSDNSLNSLTLSKYSFSNISENGETLEVDITCDGTWSAHSDAAWCNIRPKEGTGNQKLTLIIEANLDSDTRTTTITVSTNDVKQTIQISQKEASTSAENYHYNLPVIFHVFYKDQTNPLQYVSQSRLSEILDVVNKLYKDETRSINMNLTFTLATTDANGTTLKSPGVEYIQWPGTYPVDCEKFMEDTTENYVKYLWDPNQYINVMIYNFTTYESNATILGISHLPFTTRGSTFLEGVNPTDMSYISLRNLKIPYCVSINSLFIDEESIGTKYSTADVTVTLAHELGHYLGLHHVFSEDEEGTCKDTDYCEDTPSYNKKEYDEYYLWVMAGNVPANERFSYLVKRTNCSSQQFISYNIMDYAVSYSNQFTEDQRQRIRHVLEYSPLIPGPKKGRSGARSVAEGPLDLPIRTIK